MKTVKDCKLFDPVVVKDTENIVKVAKKLHDFQERRVFVVNSKKYPIGIISVVDINDRVVAKNMDLKKTTAKDIMSYPLNVVIDINEPIKEAARKMVVKDTFYCPVVDRGVLKGMLTYNALLQVLPKKRK